MLEEYGEEIEDPLAEISYPKDEFYKDRKEDVSDEETANWQADQLYNYSTDVEYQANITRKRENLEGLDQKHGTNFLK